MRGQPGFWDLDERYERLSAVGDPLEKLNSIIPWAVFAKPLAKALKRSDGSKGGRPPFPAVLMFKILVLQALYNLSDDQAADYFFWGVRSWLAGTANVLPRQHVEILNAANSGDLAGARKQFEQILPWVQHMEAGSYNQKAKLGLRHLGLDCGEVRQPLLPLSDADAATLVEILDGVLR